MGKSKQAIGMGQLKGDLFNDPSIEVQECTPGGAMEMTNAPELINGRVVMMADFVAFE